MSTPAAPQFDLFAHSQDTMLCNDALDALLRHDAVAADAARSALAGHAPQHHALPALATLLDALAAHADRAPFVQPGDAALAAGRLAAVAPVARAQFGAVAAAPWLAAMWRQLAARAAQRPFRPAQPEDHAAPLWLRAGDAADARAAAQAVAGIESWWRQPAPLAWMAQARHATLGLDATWPLLAELAWLSAPRLVDTAQAIRDPLLDRLLRRFDEQFDPGPSKDAAAAPLLPAWLPAWLLTEQPALLPLLRTTRRGQDTAPERAFWHLVELLGLERQGRHHELITGRQQLRSQQPALYAAYLQSR